MDKREGGEERRKGATVSIEGEMRRRGEVKNGGGGRRGGEGRWTGVNEKRREVKDRIGGEKERRNDR